MPWVKIDDQFAEHPKFVALDPAAIGLWVSGLAYCSRYLTDGLIPKAAAFRLVNLPPHQTRKLVQRLINVALWCDANLHYVVHDYLVFQRSREDVRTIKERAKTRANRWKQRRSNAVSNAVSNAAATPLGRGPDTDTDTDTPIRPPKHKRVTNAVTPHDAFVAFYELYPRKRNPCAAERALSAALSRAPIDLILAGLRAQLPTLTNTESRFIPHPATWLNADAWNSQPDPPPHDPYANFPTA
jgi:hypothetical protein